MNPRLRKAHVRTKAEDGKTWVFCLDPLRGVITARPLRGKTHQMTMAQLVGLMRQCPAPDGSPVPEDHRQLKLPGVGA
jgi:hypothetical protein